MDIIKYNFSVFLLMGFGYGLALGLITSMACFCLKKLIDVFKIIS